ncbi:MAG: TetR/AcrR family transcriptional regulator [Actinobacteria bacterium]|nr:MAG: TetR/AcrR family transcriptional regulator [Actinomycetota bacterium]
MLVAPSTKEQIVRVAERLLGERGLEGVSLRQIGAAAGSGNNSAVQYHFGSKDVLIQAIFEYRLPDLNARRRLLIAERRPADLRTWVECFALPILELAEQDGSHYCTFVAMLAHHGRVDVVERVPDEYKASTRAFHDQFAAFLPHLPAPLRTHRILQAMAFGVYAAADRELARSGDQPVLPYAVYVSALFDGLVGFLQAPASPTALAALDETYTDRLTRALFP